MTIKLLLDPVPDDTMVHKCRACKCLFAFTDVNVEMTKLEFQFRLWVICPGCHTQETVGYENFPGDTVEFVD